MKMTIQMFHRSFYNIISSRFAVMLLLFTGIATAAQAQDTLLQKQTIDIYNVYQPELRNAAKLNLTATLPAFDTTKPQLVYNIPAQNLYFSYQPVSLRPLAMGKDSLAELQEYNFVKAGFGNYSTPFIQVGLGSAPNNTYNYSLFFNHLSSKGDIQYQNFSNDNLHASGQFFSDTHEFHASAGYDRNAVNYYGYDHDTTKLNRDDVRQTYNTITLRAGLSNIVDNRIKLNYQPEFKIVNFFDAGDRRESTFYMKIPVQKKIVDGISIVADIMGDFSSYHGEHDSTFNNPLMTIHPAVLISKKGFFLRAGVNPSWTNDKFYLLPDFVNETDLIDDKLILSSGWISYFIKNSYQHLAGENPFIGEFPHPLNTRVEEKYTGIKGTIDHHFTYNTKFSLVTYHNRPLFVNDSVYGNKFNLRNEEELKAYQLHAEVGYAAEEKFQLKLSGDWYNYFKEENEDKPWGLVPFQANLFGTYSIGKNFRIQADVFALSGSFYQENGNHFKTKGAFDVNMGASYQINKNFGIWLNVNNMQNSHYQRWHNYPSLGLNALGGILIKF